jgi:hypothetical protein
VSIHCSTDGKKKSCYAQVVYQCHHWQHLEDADSDDIYNSNLAMYYASELVYPTIRDDQEPTEWR